MKLTAGATLQNGKYLIQGVKSGHLSVTCQAIHTYLDQTVTLQTFSEAVQQHNQFGRLQKQFLDKVRELSRQPSSNKIPVLDYFEEENIPFVVLKCSPEQTSVAPSPQDSPPDSLQSSPQNNVPQLEDWFPITLDVPTEASQNQARPEELKVEAAPDLATIETIPPNSQYQTAQTNGLRSPSHEPTHHVTVTVGGKRSPQTQAQAKAKTFNQSRPRLPIALMIVALVGGATGAGMGLAFRLSSAQAGESSTPRISFFNREQNFSSGGDWPIQEDEVYEPEPAIEQPLYRTNPSVEYDPLPQPLYPETTGLTDPDSTDVLPSPEAVTPVEPIDVPPVKSNPKLPEEALPSLEAPVITESEPTIEPAPLVEPITPPPVLPQPVLPPIDTIPPQSNQKPLLDNSLNIVSQ